MKKALFAALTAATLVLPEAALANGRFPEANQLVFSPTDPNYVLLRVTFGLMVSRDRGATWNWICEQAIGFSGVEDPMYAITPSRTVLGTTFQGLSKTTNDGCNWSFVPGELDKQVFIDLTTRPTTPANVLTFASSYDHQDDAGLIYFRSRLFETIDEGQSFQELVPNGGTDGGTDGGPAGGLDTTLLGYTVDFAASDPNRIYLSATRDPGTRPRGFVLTSRDHGQTYSETEVQLTDQEVALYIAGIDPNNADRVYARTASGSDKPTRLLVSDDGGGSFRAVFSAEGPLQGFALSKDGSKVFVGGPRVSILPDPMKPPVTRTVGLFMANATDLVFNRVNTIDIHCLSVQDDGLWACSNETNGGFVLGTSSDEGKTFAPRMHFCDVKGPIACPPGTPVTDVCAPAWQAQRATFACDGDAGEPAPEPKSCDCRASAPETPWTALLLGPGALIAFALVRRRRRR